VAKLNLTETVRVTLPSGQPRTLVLLHNGSLLTHLNGIAAFASTDLPDCYFLANSILTADLRKGGLTIEDLNTIWVFRHTGVFPALPKYSPEREKFIRHTSEGFLAIDPYAHEAPRTGDLLIQRTHKILRAPNDPKEHIFMVRDYNVGTWTAKVVETLPNGVDLQETQFGLSDDPLDAHERFIKPGLLLLRLRPTTHAACIYKDENAAAADPVSGQAPPPGKGVAR
jgi:hypothetical protein